MPPLLNDPEKLRDALKRMAEFTGYDEDHFSGAVSTQQVADGILADLEKGASHWYENLHMTKDAFLEGLSKFAKESPDYASLFKTGTI